MPGPMSPLAPIRAGLRRQRLRHQRFRGQESPHQKSRVGQQPL